MSELRRLGRCVVCGQNVTHETAWEFLYGRSERTGKGCRIVVCDGKCLATWDGRHVAAVEAIADVLRAQWE